MNALFRWAYKTRAKHYATRLLPKIHRGEKVLDIGAGSGYLAEQLSTKANITLIDILDYNQTELPLLLYDGTALNFADESFDVGLIVTVLHHTPDPETFLEECKRVCKRIIIIEEVHSSIFSKQFMDGWEWFWNHTSGIDTFYNFHSRQEWMRIFDNIGMKLITVEEFRGSLRTLRMNLFVLAQDGR